VSALPGLWGFGFLAGLLGPGAGVAVGAAVLEELEDSELMVGVWLVTTEYRSAWFVLKATQKSTWSPCCPLFITEKLCSRRIKISWQDQKDM